MIVGRPGNRAAQGGVLGWAAIAALLALAAAGVASAAPPATRVVRGIEYARPAGVRLLLDAYLPRSASPRPAIIFVHGGGWRAGDRSTFALGEQAFAPTALRLARLGYAVFSIDYRLAPSFRFPAQVDDVEAAVRWVRAHARSLHVDGRRLALFGVSAGGNLAALAAFRGRGDLSRGSRVRALVVWSSPMELRSFATPTRPQVEVYLGCSSNACPDRYRAASPTSYVDRSDPPTLIANGTSEIVPLAQAQTLMRKLEAVHVPERLLLVRGARHAGEYAADVLSATVSFLRSRLG